MDAKTETPAPAAPAKKAAAPVSKKVALKKTVVKSAAPLLGTKVATKKAAAKKVIAKKAVAPVKKAAAAPATKPGKKAEKVVKLDKLDKVDKKQVKAAKPVKEKLVRDSFTMPQADFALIDALKGRALNFKRPTKKSELLRAGLRALDALSDAALQAVLAGLTPLKPGRPKAEDKPADKA